MLDNIPVYVLCLRELPDRTAYITEHFQKHGINWKPWYGFPGVPMGLMTSKPYYTDNHTETPCDKCGNETAYRINPGTVAVTLSHLALLKHIVATGQRHALIFENDVVLPDNFRERFERFYASLPEDWDMAYLGWGSGNADWDNNPANTNSVSPEVCIIPNGSMQTHAYMVSERAARVLDERCQQAWRPIDVSYMLESRGRLKTYYANPKICEQLTQSGKLAASLHFDASKFTPIPETPTPLTMRLENGRWDWK